MVPPSDIRPEERLLLCCARTNKSLAITAQVEALLRGHIDWIYTIETAHAHGVAPLLYWHLAAASTDAVPKHAFDHLRDHFHDNSLRNLSLTGDLLELLNVFRDHRVPAVPYKGPVLAASVYGNLALRRFIDLDVIVHRHDVPKAEELLASLGYRPQYQLTRAQEGPLFGAQGEYIFTRDDGETIVELHWEAPEYFSLPLDTQRLCERLEEVPLGSHTVPTLSP